MDEKKFIKLVSNVKSFGGVIVQRTDKRELCRVNLTALYGDVLYRGQKYMVSVYARINDILFRISWYDKNGQYHFVDRIAKG